MEQLEKDFIKSLRRALAVWAHILGLICALFQIAGLCMEMNIGGGDWLFVGQLMLAFLAFFLALFALIAFIIWLRAMWSRTTIRHWSVNSDVYRLEKEYAASHPVYKYKGSELHLMPNFILCFSMGTLRLVPIHEIERVELNTLTYNVFSNTACVRFFRTTGQATNIPLPSYCTFMYKSRRYQDLQAILAWLENRFRNEKFAR